MFRIFPWIAAFLLIPAALAMEGPSGHDPVDEHEAWTLTAMNRLSEALTDYRDAHGRLPVAGPGPVEVETLRTELEPAHLESMPVEDGWRNPLRYWSDGSRYAVISQGRDGEPAGRYAELPEVPEPGDDFILIDGRLRFGPGHILGVMELGSQKRTMADIRSIAICLESYKLDHGELPGAPTPGWVEVETLAELLQPVYIRTLPVEDAWGHPFRVWSDGERYRIVSTGRDGTPDTDWTVADGAGGTSGFDRDIVMGDGQFLQWPEGRQR